jgi:hypothetical protein
MTVKFKIKSQVHPVLDVILLEYKLRIVPLMPSVTDKYFRIENCPLEARGELQVCADVEEVVDDYGNHVPL